MDLETIMAGHVQPEPVEHIRVDPSVVRIWHGNARSYEMLDYENTHDLTTSIRAEGQRVPVIVRRVHKDPAHDYELIAGTRRHWAVSWLRKREGHDVLLLAEVGVISDAEAFRISDLENRARRDVTDLERARNYVWALEELFEGHQAKMAGALGVHSSWLSKILAVGRIPDEVVKAFASPSDIKIKPGYALAAALAQGHRAKGILKRAAELASFEANRVSERPLTPAKVVHRLLNDPPQLPTREPVEWHSRTGRPCLTLQKRDANGLVIRVHLHSDADEEETVAAFRTALKHLSPEQRGGG